MVRTKEIKPTDEIRRECSCGQGIAALRQDQPLWDEWDKTHTGDGHALVPSTYEKLLRPVKWRRTEKGEYYAVPLDVPRDVDDDSAMA